MAKNKISEWSSTPANNTDVGGIDIAEGCAPSGINNAIREVMAQVKDMITGADGDSQVVGGNLTVDGTSTLTGAVSAPAGITGNVTGNVTGNINGTVGATTPAAGTFTSLSDSGNLTFTGTANRITGDFTNATLASRVAIQTSTANSSTVVGVLPSGTGTVSSINLFGNSDTTANAPYTILSQTGGKTILEANRIGTGTYGNIEFWAGGVKAAYINAADNTFNTLGALNVTESTSGLAVIEIGASRAVSGATYIDFHSSVGTDYDFRILRGSGTNGGAQILNVGTGTLLVQANTNGVNLTNGATSWTSASDENRKNIIEPISNGVHKVSQLRAVIGNYKTDEEGTRRSFLIAQDVQKVLPEAIETLEDEQGEFLGLAYTDVIPLLVSAINELSARVKELEAK